VLIVTACRYYGAMARKSGARRQSDGGEVLDRALAELWTSISSGDILSAEMQASSLIALPLLTAGTDAEYDQLADGLISAAEAQGHEPEEAAAALLVYVASMFTLSAGQIDGMRPAVTAWARWAVRRQGLDQAATETLLKHLTRAARFGRG
jgi:hypothetical protein